MTLPLDVQLRTAELQIAMLRADLDNERRKVAELEAEVARLRAIVRLNEWRAP